MTFSSKIRWFDSKSGWIKRGFLLQKGGDEIIYSKNDNGLDNEKGRRTRPRHFQGLFHRALEKAINIYRMIQMMRLVKTKIG